MEYSFCPKCGGDTVRTLPNLLLCQKCGYNFYLNPAATNAVILENSKGEVLLVTRKFDPMKGYLDLPGGFVESGESLEESSFRELQEELGIDINNVTYFGSYPDEYLYQGVNIKTLGFILTAKVDDDIKITVSDDVADAKFYKKDELPLEKVAFDSLKKGLVDYLNKKA